MAILRTILFMVSVLALSTCKTTDKTGSSAVKLDGKPPAIPEHSPFSEISYPAIDEELGEEYYQRGYRSLVRGNAPAYADELYYGQAITAEIENQIRDRFREGRVKRDAHPKTHGCVKASFRVLTPGTSSLEADAFQGIFSPGRVYEATIRFSNGSSNPKAPDIDKDARGMAIKVHGVDGPILLDNAQENVQDFIMINYPVFVVDSPHEYFDIVEKAESSSILDKVDVFESLGLRGFRIVSSLRKIQINSPLDTQYFSMVPYQLGTGAAKKAVKYSARPCAYGPRFGDDRNSLRDYDKQLAAGANDLPVDPHPDYLRQRLYDQLNAQEGCFEFMVQINRGKMPVETSTTLWKESESQFKPIARLTIYKNDRQDLVRENDDQLPANVACDNQRFNPWHAMAAHKPLGAVNRLRKVIYEHISKVRRQANDERGL